MLNNIGKFRANVSEMLLHFFRETESKIFLTKNCQWISFEKEIWKSCTNKTFDTLIQNFHLKKILKNFLILVI